MAADVSQQRIKYFCYIQYKYTQKGQPHYTQLNHLKQVLMDSMSGSIKEWEILMEV